MSSDNNQPIIQQTEDTSSGFKRQGSIRKVVPSQPGTEDAVKLIDRPGTSSGSDIRTNSPFTPFFLEYSLIPEFNLLNSKKLPGVYVIPSAKSPLVWFGVLFVRQGLYEGGIFRFNIHIPTNFPHVGCPKIIFQTPVFHPMIKPDTGELNTRKAFPEWNKNINHIYHIVDYARKIFLKIDLSSSVNQNAAHLYENDNDKFVEAVQECVKNSQSIVYESPQIDDPNYITFDQYDPLIHDRFKQHMINPQAEEEEHIQSKGISWIESGTYKSFSKPSSIVPSQESQQV